MIPTISFFVPGLPKPAGSKRGFAIKKAGSYTGRVAIVDASKGSKDWKRTVSCEARLHVGDGDALIEGPLAVSLTFHVMRPKCHYRTGKNSRLLREGAPAFPIGKPDVLKLARGVEDALTAIIWKDDAQIVTEHLKKIYADRPGCQIVIRQEEEIQPTLK